MTIKKIDPPKVDSWNYQGYQVQVAIDISRYCCI